MATPVMGRASSAWRDGVLRTRGDGVTEVRAIELFFDLVYVLAVTQMTHHLVEHLSWRGAAETGLLLLGVWHVWHYTSWFTNFFEPDARPVRVFLLVLMLLSLIMSASIPEAFGDRGLGFAIPLVLIEIGRPLFMVAAAGLGHIIGQNFRRVAIWFTVAGLFWVGGALLEDDARIACWVVAVAIQYAGGVLAFPVPGLGHSQTTDWTIAGEHLAERCRLFVIVALGESILVTGRVVSDLPVDAERTVALVVAFVGSVALWWLYFDRLEEAGRHLIGSAMDPGRLGRSAYYYYHVPIVAGIIVVAAGDEMAIAHPNDDTTTASALLLLGGPALFLFGLVLMKWALWGRLSYPRLAAIVLLGALGFVATDSTALVLSLLVTVLLVGLAVWDVCTEGIRPWPVPNLNPE
jgi:low temperature requirement protein LtrA